MARKIVSVSRQPTEIMKKAGPKLAALVNIVGRPVSDTTVVNYIEKTLGKKPP